MAGARGYIGSGRSQRVEAAFWTPAVLGSAVVAWWDVLSPMTITLEGMAVSEIRDRSGFGHDLSQPDHSKQPEWVEHEVGNSFEAAFFDGRDDQMVSDVQVEQPFTVVQLIRTGDELEPFASSFQAGVDDALVYLRNEDLDNEVALGAGDVVGTGKVLDLNTNYIMVSHFGDADSYVSVNGEVFMAPNIGDAGISDPARV